MFHVKRNWKSFLVVSDLHAGGGGRADDFGRHADLFAALMRHCANIGLPVVGAGDWAETWQFKAAEIEREHARHFVAVRELSRRGLFAFAAGNHDLDIGLLAMLGNDSVGDYVDVDTGSGVWRVEHGHQHDRTNRSPGIKHRVGVRIARWLEEHVSSDIDVLDNYRRAPARDEDSLARAARKMIGTGNFVGVAMGHTHRPVRLEIVECVHKGLYLNSGAWTQARTPHVALIHGARGAVVAVRSPAVFRLIRP